MLSRSLYFMGMEPTIKSSEEGRYILVATKVKKLNAQREADNLISKYYKKKERTMNSNQNQGRRINSTPTHFSSDASALANKHPTTNSYFNITHANIMNQRPVTISIPPILIPTSQISVIIPHLIDYLAKITHSMITLPNSAIFLIKVTHLNTIIIKPTPMQKIIHQISQIIL